MGAGGYLTGVSIGVDGTTAIRTDTYGGYVWDSTGLSPVGTTGTWRQVIRPSSMPAGYDALSVGNLGGVWELQVSYSSPNILYMIYNDLVALAPANFTVYRSADRGKTWAVTGFVPACFEPSGNLFDSGKRAGANIDLKAWGNRLVIDPTDPTFVVAGANNTGLFWNSNSGIGSWGTVSTSQVPVPLQWSTTGYWPGYTLGIGRFSSIQYVVAFSYGNGIYITSNIAGGSWANITSGGPSIPQRWSFDPGAGSFFCIDGATGNAWKYNASAGGSAVWSEVYSGGGCQDIACDQTTANHIVITNSATLAESTNGTSFGTFTQLGSLDTTGDVPWVDFFTPSGGGPTNLVFDPTAPNSIVMVNDRASGVASWTGALSSGVTLGYQGRNRGIEQLVGNCVTVPKTLNPILGFWDSGCARQSNLSGYLSSGALPGIGAVQMASCINFASSDPNFVAALIDGGGGIDGGGPDSSVFSTDCGATWNPFPSVPSGTGNAGSLAISTFDNMIFAPGNGRQPYYTMNFTSGQPSSVVWSPCLLPSNQTSWAGFTNNTLHGGRFIDADRGNPNTFYMTWSDGNVYISTDGGATWNSLGAPTSMNAQNSAWLKTTPAVAGDFWLAGAGPPYHYFRGSLLQITNVQSAGLIGTGANRNGGYPSVFMVGYISNIYGIYRADDAATTATPTWQQIGPWAGDTFDSLKDISGDPAIPDQCYAALSGSGFAYYKAA